MELKKVEKLEYIRGQGIIIDNKKYGIGIGKVEIDGAIIKVYIHKSILLKRYDDIIKEKQYKDFSNPYDLIQYDNIKIVEE